MSAEERPRRRNLPRSRVVAFALFAVSSCHASHETGALDLRLKWVVDPPSALDFSTAPENPVNIPYGNVIDINGSGFGPYTFAPLGLQVNDLGGVTNPSWFLADFSPQTSVGSISGRATSNTLDRLDATLAGDLAETNSGVVTSYDVIASAAPSGGFAYTVQGMQDGPTYPMVGSDVTSAALTSYVASEGSAGRVVTALSTSPNAGLLRVYSHEREGDDTTFETTVVNTTAEQFVTQTTALAGSGYVITAVGHVGDDAVVVVGTRSATMPASFTTNEQTSVLGPSGPVTGALVGWVFAVEGSGGSDDLNEIVFEQ
jgi:hypothetical protein